MTGKAYLVIWPERRVVYEPQIRVWYEDAVLNGDAEQTDLNEPDEMAQELSNIGIITLGNFK